LSLSGAVLIGLLGCGPTAQRHYVPAIGRLPNARLTAAYDPLPEPRQIVARLAPGCRAFDSVEALLAARVVDAAVIGGPAESRASLAVSALGAGLPVLVLPPLAASLEEADWIAEAERAVRLPVVVGFHQWWWEPAERLRRVLASRPEGELLVESTVAIDAGEADPFVVLAAHLDLVRHLVDREIAMVSGRRDEPGEIRAQLTFHGGGLARCLARPGSTQHERITVRSGARAYVVRSGSGRIWPPGGPARRVMDLVDSSVGHVVGRRDAVRRSYEGLLSAFVRAAQTRTFVGPGSSVGIAALLAVLALRRSLEAGGTEMIVPATPSNRPEAG
jgi:predicted dehydrogenase